MNSLYVKMLKAKKLKAIFIESSFPSSQKDAQLFGHLTPKWLMREMEKLADEAGAENLKVVSIVVTHIKPTANNEKIIKQEINRQNKLKLRIIYPMQGKLLNF